MKLVNHLSKEQHEKLKKYNNKNKKKNFERINWNELMGVHRDTYKRGKGGAFRRR